MLFLFESTHMAIKAEKILAGNNYKYKVVPVPKSISPECGIAIDVYDELANEVESIFKNIEIKFLKHGGSKKSY